MKTITEFILDFDKDTQTYYKLLKEEDFDFKTKNININLNFSSDKLNVKITAPSIIELKIGTNAFIKSLEIIQKTLTI